MKEIIEIFELAKNQLESEELNESENQLSSKEKAFRSKVNSVYRIATLSFALASTLAGIFFPPTAIIGACIALILTLLHQYDKKQDYKLSHKVAQLWQKVTGKEEELVELKKNLSEKLVELNRPKEDKKSQLLERKNTPEKVSLQKVGFFSKKLSPKPELGMHNRKDSEIEMVAVYK